MVPCTPPGGSYLWVRVYYLYTPIYSSALTTVYPGDDIVHAGEHPLHAMFKASLFVGVG